VLGLQATRVRPIAQRLADLGIATSCKVLHGGDPVSRLDDFAGDFDDAVLVATSSHWTTPKTHWYSTTRRLTPAIHQARSRRASRVTTSPRGDRHRSGNSSRDDEHHT
jgi:hypothetical protein